jgi:probable rRNA maturation factor
MSAGKCSIEIAVDGFPAPRWRRGLSRFCVNALTEAGFTQWEISLLLCDDARIASLNGRYRGLHRPTDVLSFAGESGGTPGRVSGDIAISLDTLRRNAIAFGVTEDEELKRLTIHGILHLAGMDHGRGKGRQMRDLQEKLLESLRAARIIRE